MEGEQQSPAAAVVFSLLTSALNRRPGQPMPDFPKQRFDSVELPEECGDHAYEKRENRDWE
jgi:hypothetical protein